MAAVQHVSGGQLERCQKEAQLLVAEAPRFPVDLSRQAAHLKACSLSSSPWHACFTVACPSHKHAVCIMCAAAAAAAAWHSLS